MSFADVLRFSSGALRGHGLRTGLSMLGVAIGVASVILLTALGEGARTYVTEEFASLGTNILIVVPGRTETTGGLPGIGGVPEDLTLRDAEALLRTSNAIETLTPMVVGTETVSHLQRSRQVMIIGTTAEMEPVRDIRMARGSFLPDGEWDRGTSVVVIGSDVATELFPGVDPVGQVMRIGDFRMRVIGVMAERGVSLGVDFDNIVMIPVATGMRLFNRSTLFRIMIKHDPRADLDRIRAEVTRVLMERHDGEEDFTLITQDAVMSAFSQIFAALTAALAGIAAISLTVAGIGIMNVMLVAVSERTREIGLLKALGAHPQQILTAFLVEAVLLSALGGAVGLAAAWATVRAVVAAYPVFPATTPAWAVAAALGVSLIVGAVFGVLPARHATRLDPIAALRS
jgi:putative ABC transport system permease protein